MGRDLQEVELVDEQEHFHDEHIGWGNPAKSRWNLGSTGLGSNKRSGIASMPRQPRGAGWSVAGYSTGACRACLRRRLILL